MTDTERDITKERILALLKSQEAAIDSIAADHKRAVKLLESIHPGKDRAELCMARVIVVTCQVLGFLLLCCVFVPFAAFFCGLIYSPFQ